MVVKVSLAGRCRARQRCNAEKGSNDTIIEDALKVGGTRITRPGSAAVTKEVLASGSVVRARKGWNNDPCQMCGDDARDSGEFKAGALQRAAAKVLHGE